MISNKSILWCRTFAQGFSGESKANIKKSIELYKKHYVNDQMQLMTSKLVEKDDKVNWSKMTEDILQCNGNINQSNLNAVLIKFLINRHKYEKAKSFIDYLMEKNSNISLGATNTIIQYYASVANEKPLTQSEKKFITDSYENIINKYKVLDFRTYDCFLSAFAVLGDGGKCLELLNKISLLDSPSQNAYSSTAHILFKNNKEEDALYVIKESLANKKSLKDEVYLAWIEFCCRNFKERSKLKSKLVEILLSISNLDETLGLAVVSKLKDVFENELGWNANFATVSASGRCDSCNNNLAHLKVSEDEFEQLQNEFKSKVLIGSNIYTKTSPEEIDKFINYLKRIKSYDIVIDSLNVSFCIGRGNNWEKSKFLADVVGYFLRMGKKVFVLGRKHMLKWPPKNMELVLRDTQHFFTDDLSEDDPFFLTAAMFSGPHTDIVSKDKLRGHKFLLGNLRLQSVFLRWQWQHQWSVYTINKKQPVIQKPLSFTPCAQSDSSGLSWHIPYTEVVSNKDPINQPIPTSWLCLKSK